MVSANGHKVLSFPAFVNHRYKPAVMPLLSLEWRKTVQFQLDRLATAFPGELGSIGPEAVERWWAQLRSNGHSPAYCNKFLVRLRAVFSKAEHWGYVTGDPSQRVKKLRENVDPDKWFPPSEWHTLLDRCTNPMLKLYLQAGYYTGARRKTLWSLLEGHLNLEQNTIRLPRPKGKPDKVMPLDPRLKALLEPRLTGDATAPLLPRVRLDSISRACKRLTTKLAQEGALRAALPFHTTRHTTASHLALAGAQQKTIMMALDHADLRMSNRYTHLGDDTLRTAFQTLL